MNPRQVLNSGLTNLKKKKKQTSKGQTAVFDGVVKRKALRLDMKEKSVSFT